MAEGSLAKDGHVDTRVPIRLADYSLRRLGERIGGGKSGVR